MMMDARLYCRRQSIRYATINDDLSGIIRVCMLCACLISLAAANDAAAAAAAAAAGGGDALASLF